MALLERLKKDVTWLRSHGSRQSTLAAPWKTEAQGGVIGSEQILCPQMVLRSEVAIHHENDHLHRGGLPVGSTGKGWTKNSTFLVWTFLLLQWPRPPARYASLDELHVSGQRPLWGWSKGAVRSQPLFFGLLDVLDGKANFGIVVPNSTFKFWVPFF